MRMRIFTMNPVEQQPYAMDRFNEALKGAVHVETYTKDEGRFGDDRTITIFAFYPDEPTPCHSQLPCQLLKNTRQCLVETTEILTELRIKCRENHNG